MPSDKNLQAELERLRTENEALKQGNERGGSTSLKVSEKGRFLFTVTRPKTPARYTGYSEVAGTLPGTTRSLRARHSA